MKFVSVAMYLQYTSCTNNDHQATRLVTTIAHVSVASNPIISSLNMNQIHKQIYTI